MNGEDIKWLEKLFKQHKEEQRYYLDDKFETINKKLDTRMQDCKNCRACIDSNIASLDEKIARSDTITTKKVIAGSAIAVIISLSMWAIFGTNALAQALNFLSKISVIGM